MHLQLWQVHFSYSWYDVATRAHSAACQRAHGCGVRLVNITILQLASWLCGLCIFWSVDSPCNDKACLYCLSFQCYCTDPWYQWAKRCHIPHVERREKRLLPDDSEGFTATAVLGVPACHSHVWWEELCRQVQTRGDLTAAWVSTLISFLWMNERHLLMNSASVVFTIYQLSLVWGRGTPLPPLVHLLPHLFPFYFSLSFIGFTCFLLLSIPSLSTRIVSLRFQAGGRRRRPNPGLVCFFCVICVICIP